MSKEEEKGYESGVVTIKRKQECRCSLVAALAMMKEKCGSKRVVI